MYENFKCSGEWWLPQNPDNRLSGYLIYDKQKGFLLSLIGEFKEDFSSKSSKQPSIIVGYTKEHGEVTLFRCILNDAPTTGRKISGGMWLEFTVSTFNPQYIFLGAPFQTVDEIQFKKMYVRFTNFEEWVETSGFSFPTLRKSSTTPYPFEMAYKKPDDIKIQLNENCSLTIHFSFKFPSLNYVQKEVNCEQATSLLIEFNEMTPLEEFLKISHVFKNFLSFATKNPEYIIEMRGITKSSYKDRDKEEITEDLSVEIKTEYFEKDEKFRRVLPPQMLFSYKALSPKTELIVLKWFEITEKYEPVFNLFFSTSHSEKLSLENKFLNYMQAIEAYHRRAFVNIVENPVDHKKKIDGILSAVSEENKTWVSQKLQYSNEKNLKTRLNEIFIKNVKIISPFFENEKECRKFIRTVVNVRNDFTHWDPTRKPISFDKLFYLVIKMKLVLSICILTELGLDDDKVEQFSKNLVSATRYQTLIEFD